MQAILGLQEAGVCITLAPTKNHFSKEFPMKVRIDPDLCTGCGLCSDSVPDVFKMDDDIAEVIAAEVPSNLESAVQEAVDDCPAEAIISE
jgi:ferredoxin